MNFTCEYEICSKQNRRKVGSIFRRRCWVNNAGFSLIELVVTISIMGILMGIAGLSFSSWQKKSKFESQVREMYADLVDARNRAFTQKKVHGIVFQPNGYVMKSYSSEAEYKFSSDAAANGVEIMNKPLKFGITKTNTTVFTDSNSSILFDTTGYTTTVTGFTVINNPVTVSPNLNCLVISATRVNMGKWNATTTKCEFN